MFTKTTLISAFFDKLCGIQYVVLRGYDKIPDRITGDIDIMIAREDFSKFSKVIDTIKATYGLFEMERIDREYVRMFRLLRTAPGNNFALKIDIHFEENFRGAAYIKGEDILTRKIQYNQIFIPSYEDQVCINLFQGLLGMGYVTEKRIGQINALLNKVNWIELEGMIKSILNPGLGSELSKYLENRSYSKISQLANTYRRIIWTNTFKEAPKYTIISSTNYLYKNLRYKILPPGVFIALIGPDGAGKSTAIKNVTNFLDQVVINGNSCVIAWKPEYLKRLATLKKDTSLDKLSKEEKANYIPGRISSLFRFIYYCLDYILGHYMRNRRILEAEGYVLYDRYSYDYVVQPANRSFINLNGKVKNLISYFVPKPDLTIYFSANAEVLFARKQEETLEELKDLVKRYEEYTSNNGNIVKINALNDVSTVEYDILTSFANHYAK